MRESPFEVFYSHTNPIEAWKGVPEEKMSEAIKTDYQDWKRNHLKGFGLGTDNYINGFVMETGFFEDQTGQHAITIQTGQDGTYWTYVLIYDKNDKRIKTRKWISGHYMS
jgi:hypothetical protein